jgi:gentisate 1,2-dioxygenase
MRFPWRDVKETLDAIAKTASSGKIAHVAYVNPETGQECLPTLGFSALKLTHGEPVRLSRRSASMVLHAVQGEGVAIVDGVEFTFRESDTMAIPTHAKVSLAATGSEPTYLFMVDDAPLQRKLGIYQVFNDTMVKE